MFKKFFCKLYVPDNIEIKLFESFGNEWLSFSENDVLADSFENASFDFFKNNWLDTFENNVLDFFKSKSFEFSLDFLENCECTDDDIVGVFKYEIDVETMELGLLFFIFSTKSYSNIN